MKKIENMKNSICQSRYITLVASFAIIVYMHENDSFQFLNFAIIGVLFSIGLILNCYISEDNEGAIAIVQMILIILMIGAYDYLSKTGERLNNFLNFILPVFVLATIYGFFLKYQNNK